MGAKQSIFVDQRFQMKSGLWLKVIGYETGKKIKVRFDESGFECVVEGSQIRRANIEDVFTKYPCPGDVYEMNQNGKLEVLEYKGVQNVIVKFLDTGYTTRTEACQLVRGTVKDLLLPRVHGVGFIGGENHPAYNSEGAVWAYSKWSGILERCYDPSSLQMYECYKDVTVCNEWLNYQNFAEWAKQQIGYGNRNWATEKDLLIRGNRIYSPDSCCFLPAELNNQLLKATKARGECVIGVNVNKPNGKFIAHCQGWREDSATSHIGIFDTELEAFHAYKREKEKKLKRLAQKWKDQIDNRAYEALMAYEVLITD
jgi:hypothetical protein